jgi:hypothetical protein
MILWEGGSAGDLLAESRPDDVAANATVVVVRYLGPDAFV